MSAAVRPIDVRTTLEKVNLPSVIVDRNGTVTWLNDAAKRLLGDVAGKPFTSIVAPEFVAVVDEHRRRKLAGEDSSDYEIEVVAPDGTRRPVEVSSVLIENGDEAHAIFGVGVAGPPRAVPSVQLTARQREVLRRLGAGQSTAEIAAALHLSTETVRNHVRHILRAFGAHSRLEAVARAHEQGVIS